ncbi:MAG: glutamate--tRNA ligase [Rhodothermales bacterium]|nr:glutamate--tRNA ligase [Rhodothermales bacterium]
MHKEKVRVRFAPSPTGLLHIGGLRTALYNYLFARKRGGSLVLRIEDTDQKRFVEEAESDILESLEWVQLSYNEGPGAGGSHGPYHQSERKQLYARYADKLVDEGAAYIGFDTSEEIEAMRSRYREKGLESVGYGVETRGEMRNSLSLSAEEVDELRASGLPYVIRLKVPENEDLSFTDLIRGEVTFNSRQVDDQVLIKSDGLPTYHLANVVDDYSMNITHVIRGEEWLPSTPKHILLYRAFGWKPPTMAHLPLILSPTGGKLSKRNAEKMGIPVSVKQYVDGGYEPEALLNFLALLGWHPSDDRELFTLEDLVDEFDLDRVGSAGVQFDLDKLKWFNEQYLRRKSNEEIAELVQPILEQKDISVAAEYVSDVAGLVKERISFVHELASYEYFFRDPVTFDAKVVKKRWNATAQELLAQVAQKLAAVEESEWDAETLHDVVQSSMEDAGLGIGKIMPQLRLAVTGASSGPDLFPTLALLGKANVVRRVTNAPEWIERSRTLE